MKIMDQFLNDLALIWPKLWDSLLDATANLWVPLAEIAASIPDWALAAAAAGVLALLAVLIFGRRPMKGDPVSRRDQNLTTTAPAVRPAPDTAAEDPADLPEAPEIAGLDEILRSRGLDQGPSGGAASAAGIGGRLRTFAGELDGLRARLDEINAVVPAAAKLFHDARDAIAEGDLSRGTDLLVRAAQEEGAAAGNLEQTAATHGQAAALARLVAGDLIAAGGAEEEAETLYRLALDAAPTSAAELRADCLGRLGALAHRRDDYRQARDCFQSALIILDDRPGEDHPDLGGVLNNLALACDLLGDQPTAEGHYQRALDADERTFGDDHPNVAAVLNNLGLLYRRQGKTHAAEPLFRRAVAIKEAILPTGDPSLALSQVNHAAVLRDLGREDDARALEHRAGLAHPPEEAETDDPTAEAIAADNAAAATQEPMEEDPPETRPAPIG